ncbi:MAG TPA: hypothetical protein VK422_10390, partial [Pyrinomonadaceae bacterium]|nr:hypothetical protein [Pyrinomonadaceae bacterium]
MLHLTRRAAAACALLLALASAAAAQEGAQTGGSKPPPAPQAVSGNLLGLDDMQRQLREQREEIDGLRAALKEQARLLDELRARVERGEAGTAAPAARPAVVADASYTPAAATGPAEAAASGRQLPRNQEAPPKQPATPAITFSGDIRFRYEAVGGQQNALATSGNPSELGN